MTFGASIRVGGGGRVWNDREGQSGRERARGRICVTLFFTVEVHSFSGTLSQFLRCFKLVKRDEFVLTS